MVSLRDTKTEKEKDMKILVTAQEPSETANVDPRFGRARHFMLYDSETGAFSAHDNSQNLNAAQGAGIQAAQNVVNLGAEVVLTGNVGPKAFATLQAGGVKICCGATGAVSEAVEAFKAGKLDGAQGSNVEGHWV